MKAALVSPDAFTVWQFRRGLIKALLGQNISVDVISADDAYVDRVRSLGVTYHSVRLSRFVNPRLDVLYTFSLWRIFRSERFDIVHNFTIKPNIYGAIAARLAGVPRIVEMVEGLGFTFSSSADFRGRALRALIKFLYRIAFGLSTCVWFLNRDDMDAMISAGIARPRKSVLIRSTGVNTDEYSIRSVDEHQLTRLKEEMGLDGDSQLVSMIVSRLVWSKGVAEFAKAAVILGTELPSARFLLVGPVDLDSPEAVDDAFLNNSLPENVLWYSFREDVRELLTLSDVVVLPSYYGEGVPRILLEGMAMSKPIVTTDNVGCREVVDDGENGFLVPVKDADALAGAIAELLHDEKKRDRFGKHSRMKVEKEFDEKIVVNQALNLLYKLDTSP